MKIFNIKEFCELILDQSDDWIYRGQPNEFDLLPSIAREPYSDLPLESFERKLIYEFQKRAQRFKKSPGMIIETLIFARHYGLPTRILDWTENPLTALWFTTFQTNDDRDEHIVWRLQKVEEIVYSQSDKELYKYIHEYYDLIQIEFPIIYFPDHFEKRIISQQSVVTIHPIRNNEIIALNKFNDESIKLEKIEIAQESCDKIQKELNAIGINYSQIYPGIEGVCKQTLWDVYKLYI